MAGERSFVVRLFADPRQLIQGFEEVKIQAGKTFGDSSEQMKGLNDVFEKTAIASAAAFAGLAAFAVKATQAAIEDQQEQEKLAQTLRNVTGATDEVVSSTEDFIAGLAKTTTFSDSELRPALSSLVVATGDVTKAQNLLTTAQDVSIATGTDLQTVSDALAKASVGNMKALQQLSPALRDNIKEGQSFDQVLQELQANFGGAADAAANTLGGQMTILQNRFGEIVESIGTSFLPILETLAGILGGVATVIENNTTAVTFLITALGTITGTIVALVAAMKVYSIVMAAAKVANTAFAASLTATGIGAIIVLIGLLVAGFITLVAKTGGVGNAFKTLANVGIAAFEMLVNKGIGLINTLIEIFNKVTGPLRAIGINVGEIGPISEVSFGRMALSAKGAADAVAGVERNIAATSGALTRFESSIKGEAAARMRSKDALDEWNKQAAQTFNATSRGTSAADKSKQAIEKLRDAVKDLGRAKDSEASSTEKVASAEDSLRRSSEGVTEAKNRLAQAIRGYGRDYKEGVAAARSLAAAQRDLTRANFGVTDAQNKVIEAQRKLDELRKRQADPEDIANKEFGLEKSKLDVEEATLRVQEAEKELAETLKDPKASPIEKRRAELALVSAKFALRESIKEVGDAERELIAVRASGATAQELAEAERDLQEAKLAVEDALERQRQAVEDLNAEQENYRKIVEGIREGDKEYIELSKDIVKAEENETQAAKDLAEARKDAAAATDAVREAERLLRESRKEAAAAGVDVKGVLANLQGRASGGPVMGGSPYIVGERGPELFIPARSGMIVPNGRLGGNATVVNVTVNAGVGTSGTQVGQEIVDVLRQYTKVSGPLSQYVAV